MRASLEIDLFHTPRLTGRRFTVAGFILQRLLLTDRGTMRTLAADGQIASDESIAGICDRHLKHWEDYGFGLWQIFETATGEYIGQCGLRNYTLRGEAAIELFFALCSAHFRRGFGIEMARAVVDIGFRDLAMPSIVAFTLPDNTASRHIMEKLGMRYHGMMQHAGLPHVLYRIENSGHPDAI